MLNKHFLSQAAVLGGGAFLLLVSSFLAFLFVGFGAGIPSIVPSSVAVVAKVHAGSPAADAGFLPGDRILAVDGRVVASWSDLLANVLPNPGKRLAVSVVRAGQEQTLEVVPREVTAGDGSKVGQIGIQNATLMTVRFLPATGASEVLREAASWFGRIIVLPAVIAYRMLCGEMDAKTLVQGAAGPLLVVQMFFEVSRQGAWALLFFWAFLGASMGMWLLVPLPGLDGGRLLMVGIGAVAGRPLEPPLGGTVHKAGLVLWLLLMLALTLRDAPRLLAGVRFFSLLVGQGWGP